MKLNGNLLFLSHIMNQKRQLSLVSLTYSTLTLIPTNFTHWKMVDSKKVSNRTVYVQPMLFINKIHDEDEKYKLKFQIKPVGSKFFDFHLRRKFV